MKESLNPAKTDDLFTIGNATFAASNTRNAPLLSTNAGIPLKEALEHASSLLRCVTELTVIDAMDKTASVHVSAAHYLSEMAAAILEDVSVSLHQGAAQP